MPDTTTEVPWTLAADHPVALLPVRLETRFTDTELLVRVYPDEIHVDSHEPPLTADEAEWGKRYWTAVWRAGLPGVETDPAERAAWEELAGRYGAERASWVARVLEPTNPQARPSGTPAFPATAPFREGPWTKRAVARAMPTRWHVHGHPIAAGAAVQRVVGKPVPRPLPIGPSPDRTADLDPAAPPVDADTAWLVDFTAAEAVGMAVRLPRAVNGVSGYRTLIAHGVVEQAGAAGEVPAEATARELADLFEAQFHTRGMGFVAPGAATNNTATAASTHSRNDPEARAALRVRHGDAAPAAPDAAARVLTTALGLPLTSTGGAGGPAAATPGALARARGAGRADDKRVRDMATALWAVTGGYTLTQLTAGRFTEGQVRGVREHLRRYVRPAGPLPMLRVGKQPYGVLPVLPVDRWVSTEMNEWPGLHPDVVPFLRTLRDRIWRPAADDPAAVPRITRAPQDDQVVARALAMAPTARRVFARSSLGVDYITALWRFAELALSEQWRTDLGAAAAALAARFGLGPFDVRLAKLVHAKESYPLDAPWTLAPETVAGGRPVDYLAALGSAARTPGELRDAVDLGPAASTPLLYRLVRHALLVEFGMAAERVLGPLAEPELVGVDDRAATQTVFTRLDSPMPGWSGSVGAWVRGPGAADSRAHQVTEASTAVRALADVPPADLERMLAQQLDTTSHRLDAWLTSLATRRLEWQRAAKPTGVHLGGYGWVTDVVPRPTAPSRVTALPPDEAGPLVNAGSDVPSPIHAPSPAHAVTAAVLRAAQRAHGDRPDAPTAVDLTSERARAAAWVLDGVRQGQPLGALLGARVERWVRDHPLPALSSWIDRLRALAPLRSSSVDTEGTPTEVVAFRDALDGLALHRRASAGRLDPVRDVGATAGSADATALAQVFAKLADLVDAVADTLLVEGVHQAVQGNPLRAGATIAAMSTGEAPPPEPESLRTPRTGDAVTHRVAVLLDGTAPDPAKWPTGAAQSRAVADPALAGWIAELLPAPGTLTAEAALADGTTRPFTLAAAALSPLDWLALVPPDPSAPLAGTDLDAHLLRAAATVSGGVRVTSVTCPDLPTMLEAARAAKDLVAGARPLRPADLTLPEHADTPPTTGTPGTGTPGTGTPDPGTGTPGGGTPGTGTPGTGTPDPGTPGGDTGTPGTGGGKPGQNPGETPPYNPHPPGGGETSLLHTSTPNDDTGTPGTHKPGHTPPPPGGGETSLLRTNTPAASAALAPASAADRAAAVTALVDRVAAQLAGTDLGQLRDGLLAANLLGVPGVVPPPAAPGDTDRGVLSALAAAALPEVTRRRDAAALEPDPVRKLGVLTGVDVLGVFTLAGDTPATATDLLASLGTSTALQGGDPTVAATRLLDVAEVRPGVDRFVTSLGYAEALGAGDSLSADVAQLPKPPAGKESAERWAGLPSTNPGTRLAFTLHLPFGAPTATTPVCGLMVEEWTEVVPRRRETTAVALHAESPDSAPPQAILLAVSPDRRAVWDPALLAETVLEALELARLRMVDLEALHPANPDALTDIGQLLPAAVLAANTAPRDAVSTDFTRALPR
ncbi:hypothetical protein UO65_4875 [Actinokineospora spheciospongiae]|uniref:Uncharacterized protein n=1 Tax=Actinokineospora spheciospongiae TaxID=909613 RepID=W7IT00_9PSEU|nr:hypothetical protein [Actinokineospora spheciospongiae]EWC59872.1 hypothetical protein UO65_4875 [Actinokineospora spheciospongiae]